MSYKSTLQKTSSTIQRAKIALPQALTIHHLDNIEQAKAIKPG